MPTLKTYESRLTVQEEQVKAKIKKLEKVISISKGDISFLIWLQENLYKERNLLTS